jgi:outer membrane biosynthesis protein TonB
MDRRNLTLVATLALISAGCPNRQTSTRLVFVPPAAQATAIAPPKSSGELVIEEPPPPQPEERPVEVQPQESPAQKPPVRPPRRRVTPAETTVEIPEPPPETVPQPTPSAPALEPRESPQQQSELRTRVVQMQESVRARIGALVHTSMASLDRKTLESARMFLVQSERARDTNDLQRAFNLARKASLLVDALEQKP